MGLIYKVTNDINDKVYIGKTTRTLEIRWKDHQKDSSTTDNKFYYAIRKYGISHFTPITIEDNIPENELNNREIYWINFYNSYKNGYNSTVGGEGSKKYSEQEILNLWNKGYTCSDISNELGCTYMTASYTLSNLGIDTEQKKQRSAKIREQKNSIPIEQYDFDGNFIKHFNSSKEIKEAGFDRNEVNRCCSHYAYSHKGFLWRRINDNLTIDEIVEMNKNKRKTTGRIRPY